MTYFNYQESEQKRKYEKMKNDAKYKMEKLEKKNKKVKKISESIEDDDSNSTSAAPQGA